MQTQRERSWLSTMKASLGLGVWDVIYGVVLLVSFCEGNFRHIIYIASGCINHVPKASVIGLNCISQPIPGNRGLSLIHGVQRAIHRGKIELAIVEAITWHPHIVSIVIVDNATFSRLYFMSMRAPNHMENVMR